MLSFARNRSRSADFKRAWSALAYSRFCSFLGGLILDQFQSLSPVERELVVVTDEGDAIAQGVGDNHVITRVVVLLGLVYLKTGVALVVFLMEIEDLEVMVFHIAYHVLRRLPPSSDVRFVIPQQYELPKRLGTQSNLVVVVLKNGQYVTRQSVAFLGIPDEDVRINKIPHTVASSQG